MTRRQRFLVLWVARLALMVLVFQMLAPDHWHAEDVVGVEGKSAHVYHCHGNVSGCAEQGGLMSSLLQVDLTPLPPNSILTSTAVSMTAPLAAFVAGADKPPRA